MKITYTIDDQHPDFVLIREISSMNSIEKVSSKRCNIDDFITGILSCASDDSFFTHIGRIPAGYVDSCIGKTGFRVAIKVEPAKQLTSYFGKEYYIPFPGLVFIFTVKKNKLSESLCFAYKNEFAGMDTELYHYPFSNVYKSGAICWGGNNLQNQAIQKLEEISILPPLFINSDGNNDLFSYGKNVKAFNSNLIAQDGLLSTFYDYLKDKQQFPEELLISSNVLLKNVFNIK